VQDWDAAPGAIDWQRLISFLQQVKETGEIPRDHRSHDHLNEQKDLPIPTELRDKWVHVFEGLKKQRQVEEGERIVWGLVDGFLLYWSPVGRVPSTRCLFIYTIHYSGGDRAARRADILTSTARRPSEAAP
jgi:hypothetical protein